MTDLEQIKQKIDIVSFISESVPLKKTGANFKGLCPFHTEKTPSFIVSPERQIWHCFGGCQDGGDIFKFLMKMENLEFPEALKILAQRAGVTLTSYQPTEQSRLRERIYQANHLASEFYNYLLVSHPLGQKGREYLTNRRITNNSITLFRLGYAPNSWDSLSKFLTKKGFSPKELDAAGLVSKSGIGRYFDRFRGRLIFPLFNHRGEVSGFAGRLLDEEVYPERERGAKYINTAETAVYVKGEILYGLNITKEEIKKGGFAVVVEGEIDAISSYQAGIRKVVAIKGSALTAGQITLLKRYTENIYLSLDADFAGDAAVHRGIEMADRAGLNIKVATFTGGKDPDELIKNLGPGAFRKAVEKAVPFYDFIIDSAVTKHDPAKPEEAKKIVMETAPFLEPIDNLVVKNHYLKKLAAKLDIEQEVLETQLAREYKKIFIPRSLAINDQPPASIRSRSELLEEYLLSLLLQSPRPSDYLLLISHRLNSEDFTTPSLAQIYQLLVSNPVEAGFNIKIFVPLVPLELLPTVDRLYLRENHLDPQKDSLILEEIQKIAWEIKELGLRQKLKTASGQIRQKGDDPELEKIFHQTSSLLQKLLEEKQLLAAKA